MPRALKSHMIWSWPSVWYPIHIAVTSGSRSCTVSFSSLLHYSLAVTWNDSPGCAQGRLLFIFLSQLKCPLLKKPFPDNVISTRFFSSTWLNPLQRIYHFILLVVNFFVCLSVYSLSLPVSQRLERRTLDQLHAAFSAISTAQGWSSSN